jgi:hypothetical protein
MRSFHDRLNQIFAFALSNTWGCAAAGNNRGQRSLDFPGQSFPKLSAFERIDTALGSPSCELASMGLSLSSQVWIEKVKRTYQERDVIGGLHKFERSTSTTDEAVQNDDQFILELLRVTELKLEVQICKYGQTLQKNPIKIPRTQDCPVINMPLHLLASARDRFFRHISRLSRKASVPSVNIRTSQAGSAIPTRNQEVTEHHPQSDLLGAATTQLTDKSRCQAPDHSISICPDFPIGFF